MTSATLHTPYDGSSRPFTIGLKPLDVATWIDIDGSYAIYIAEKQRLYATQTAQVLVAEAGSEAAQLEVRDLLLQHLPHHFPTRFERRGDELKALEQITRADPRGAATGLLARAALWVQEDLVILGRSDAGWRLTAASLCFPSAWNLVEKFGKPMAEIHGPVPGFGAGTRNAGLIERMFDNLRVEQPVIRWNWSLYSDSRLYHPASDNQMSNRFGEGPITGRVVLRLERQTLRKLPQTGDIVFSIRIYTNPLEVLASHPDGAQLAVSINSQLQDLSEAELAYKGLVGERERLADRLLQLAEGR
jgi:dimethylamine monooxygenase subunit A